MGLFIKVPLNYKQTDRKEKVLIQIKLFLVISLLVSVHPCNCKANMTSANEPHITTYLWPIQSGIGVIGTVFNGLLLYVFIQERESLTTSVNVLIW